MSEQLLSILKLCLLALLYLFFFRVVRAVWAELRTPVPVATGAGAPAPGGARAATAAAAAAAGAAPSGAPAGSPSRRRARGRPTELVATAPPQRAGTTYTVGSELTVGRAGGCAVSLPEDTFVSSLHARIYVGDGQLLVEDLGSTNGTFVNRTKVGAPVALKRGDQLQVGSTVLEVR